MKRIGWIVDVQNDFMRPPEEGGRLYVRDLFNEGDVGATQVVRSIRDAVDWMREQCEVLVYTGDWHGYEDEEIDPENPDASRGTYPPHCMGRSADPEEREGAEIIEEIRPENPLVLEHDATPEEGRDVARAALRERRPIFVHKTRFDVFVGNSASEAMLEELAKGLGGEVEVVVAGVARDVCMTQAVDGMQARGYDVTALRDTTWGLGLEAEAETLERWAGRGRVTTLDELRRSP